MSSGSIHLIQQKDDFLQLIHGFKQAIHNKVKLFV